MNLTSWELLARMALAEWQGVRKETGRKIGDSTLETPLWGSFAVKGRRDLGAIPG